MPRVVDGDSHFMEPLDMFERYIDPAFRDRTVRLATDPASGKRAMIVNNKPMKLRDVEEVLGLLSPIAPNGRIWTRASASSMAKESASR
jgi:hypothetical protein